MAVAGVRRDDGSRDGARTAPCVCEKRGWDKVGENCVVGGEERVVRADTREGEK